MSTPKSKTSRTKSPKTTRKTAVVHDFIDSQEGLSHSDVEVIAGNVGITNVNVSDVAVVKVGSDKTGDDNHNNQNLSDENQGNDKDDKGSENKHTHVNDDKNATKSAQEIAKETAQHKLAELAKQLDGLDNLGDTEQIKQQAQQALHTAQETIHDTLLHTAQVAKEHLQGLTGHDADKTARLVNDKLSHAKQGLQQTLSDVQDKAEQVVQEAQKNAQTLADRAKETLDDAKEQAKETLDNISEQTAKQADELLDKVENLLDKERDKDEKHQPANDPNANEATDEYEQAHEQKTNDKSVEKSHTLKGLGGLLATAGAYLGRGHQDKSYQSVDLYADTTTKHPFYVQGSTLGGSFVKSILGKKVTAVHGLADRFVSDDKLNAISESVYEKIAELAHAWAVKSLPADPKTLTLAQKDELAQSLADQNRALATAGSVTGFFGLKGVVMDTAWLLLVALRAVYQLSVVYDVSLTGKEGVEMAYGVLSGANLDKLQEKQVILTALALAKKTLVYAGENGLKEELVKLSSSNTTIKDFDELLKFAHLDKLVEKYGIDINGLNTRWLHRLVTVSAVGVAVHYNHGLIDEVIGTAMATFKANETLSVEYQSDENDKSTK